MAKTRTTLAAALNDNALVFRATSVTGATVGGVAKIDNEYMVITAIVSPNVTVRGRGDRGGSAVAHAILSGVTFGLPSDFMSPGAGEDTPVPTEDSDLKTIGADGVISVPIRNTTYIIVKASALASSALPDPGVDQDGLELTFIAGTDFAHVITTVTAHDGTTGLHTTLTSGAFIGSSITLLAWAGKWLVKSNNLFVVT
jgi:hypothetical protein